MMTDAITFDWPELDFGFMDEAFENVEAELPSQAGIESSFVEGVLNDTRYRKIDSDRLETAARIIARGLSGDPDAKVAMGVLATGIELANTPLGWTVARNVKKCRE